MTVHLFFTLLLFTTISLVSAGSGTLSIAQSSSSPSSELIATWNYQPPKRWEVYSYKVCWKRISGNAVKQTCKVNQATVGVSPTQYVQSGLGAGIKYKFKVIANIRKKNKHSSTKTKNVDTAKMTTASSNGNASGEEDPCPPTLPLLGDIGNLPHGFVNAAPISNSAVKVSWSLECPVWGTPTSYSLCYGLNGACLQEEDYISPSQSMYTITGLKRCRTYKIKVWAHYNVDGATAKVKLNKAHVKTMCYKAMQTDDTDCGGIGVMVCLPAEAANFYCDGQNEIQTQVSTKLNSIVEGLPFLAATGAINVTRDNLGPIISGMMKDTVAAAIEKAQVYKHLQYGRYGQTSGPIGNLIQTTTNNANLRKKNQSNAAAGTSPRPALNAEEVSEVGRLAQYLDDAVLFMIDDLTEAIGAEVGESVADLLELKEECDRRAKAQSKESNLPRPNVTGTIRDPCKNIKSPPAEVDVWAGDIADVIQDLYFRFERCVLPAVSPAEELLQVIMKNDAIMTNTPINENDEGIQNPNLSVAVKSIRPLG